MGKRKKKKEKRLKDQKIVWLERVAWIFSLWFVFYPSPYRVLLIILLALPILGMFLNSKNQPTICSLITINKDSKRKFDVIDFIDMPALAIFLRVLLDFELDNYSMLLIVGTISFLVVVLVLFTTHKLVKASSKSKTWLYLVIIFNISLYSYGATAAINCAFDYSKPKVYESEVIDKTKSRRSKGGTTYYIKINPWGHHLDAENIRVPYSQYKEIEIGETIKVDYKKGYLGIPWYYVE